MRNFSVDVLKIVLAFFVVFLHMHFLRETFPSISYVLVNGLFRIGVPVFLIISGYYFYYVDDIFKLKKWLFRVLLLYIIWMVIYIPFWKEKDYNWLTIVFGYHHLWYLIGTFFAGILLFFVRNLSKIILSTLIVLLFGLGYSIQFLANSHYFNGELDASLNLFPSYRNFLFVCFPFLSLGFIIKKYQLENTLKPSLLLVIGLCLLVVLEAVFNYKILGLAKRESVDLLFSLLIACPILFLYCKNIKKTTDSKILANISTAIFLVHPLLMEIIFGEKNSINIILFLVTLLVVSYLLVLINKKIKYLL